MALETIIDNVSPGTTYTGSGISSAIFVGQSKAISLFIEFTLGASTNAQVRVEVSPDQGETWYLVSNDAAGTVGVLTLSATANLRVPLLGPLASVTTAGGAALGALAPDEQYMRISVKRTGTAGANFTVKLSRDAA